MIYYVTLQTNGKGGFHRKIAYFAKSLEDAIRVCDAYKRDNPASHRGNAYIWRVYTPQWQLIYQPK